MKVAALFILPFLLSCGQPELTRETRVTGNQQNQESEVSGLMGVDVQGQERTCQPISEDIICTQVFTDADQFAQDCERLGRQAVQCGCHDWICID